MTEGFNQSSDTPAPDGEKPSLPSPPTSSAPTTTTSTAPRVDAVMGPEIFIGLVGPIGTDTKEIQRILEETLREVHYSCVTIRFSQLLHDYPRYADLANVSLKKEAHYERHMTAGTDLRKTFGEGSALAQLSITEIWKKRIQIHKDRGAEDAEKKGSIPIPRQAYILSSLKHPDEAVFLRRLYGSNFYLIAVHTPRERRIFTLSSEIAKSHFESDPQAWRATAEKLLNIDEKEDGEKLGQNVRGTYPEADFFIVARTSKSIREGVERFVRLVFGSPFESPTIDELSMMHAKSSGMRSADLSRQVGAAIIGHDGRVIATGCNEVPKFGGGQYWGADTNDSRDFQLRRDFNALLKDETLVEVLGRLKESDQIDPNSKPLIQDMIDDVIKKGSAGIFEGARVTNVIEFGRIIHAEMAAVTQAARFGTSVQDTTLYCTTFPCHMCARHLIASGIARVVYIEPYPKSLVRELYSDSIVVDPEAERPGFLAFVPFSGAAPRRFPEFFEKFKRKNNSGEAISWNKSVAAPTESRLISVYTMQENHAIEVLRNKIAEYKLKDPPEQAAEEQSDARSS
ncbi:hypothetical protein D3093_15170 (plasmid) [Azospirillum argentinense]|uniref:CMP/dCMP-type deaminase domain-containing protein n=1 Tax=Azospirillum argentinense TaxID=2970906 RepID=A0A4D8PHD5_9PROT|nr:anti-phage dCTP deaminase [Azospirillum argentinense]QCN97983.1 hypothetical protein D3093_15170 [Azospirillum argentinense]